MPAPTISALTPAPSRLDPNFSTVADAFLSGFPTLRTEINAFSNYLNSTALVAYAFGNGSAAAPTIRFESDPDTGLFRAEANAIGLATGAVERMRIDAAGRLGIGTTALTADLTIGGSGPTDRTIQIGSAGATRGVIATDGTSGILSIGATNDSSAGIITFKVGGALTEKVRIDAAGNLLVGKSSQNMGVNGTELPNDGGAVLTRTSLDVVSVNRLGTNGTAISFRKTGAAVGSIDVTTSATSYNTSSDYRLKEDWRDIHSASAKLMDLKPVNFAWRTSGTRTDGFLAHELAEVLPYAVTGEKDAVNEDGTPDMQSVDHSKIVPLLTAALQEAINKINALEVRLAKLEG